jgi:hypothetical protein
LGLRQQFFQLRNPPLGIINFVLLTEGYAALQGDILMELTVQRLLFL